MKQVMRTNEELHLHTYELWGSNDFNRVLYELLKQKSKGEEISWSCTDSYVCETDNNFNGKIFRVVLIKCSMRVFKEIENELGF